LANRVREPVSAAEKRGSCRGGKRKPGSLIDLEVKDADPEWKPEWNALFTQLTLFGRRECAEQVPERALST
jgi:hypothetical protein